MFHLRTSSLLAGDLLPGLLSSAVLLAAALRRTWHISSSQAAISANDGRDRGGYGPATPGFAGDDVDFGAGYLCPVLSVEERVAAAMTAPLERVVVAGQAVRPPEDLVRQWDLPEPDRLALLRLGLPDDQFMRPVFQAGGDPALVPSLAGERERQVASPGDRLYTLVHWGREELQLRIGAVAGTGRVLKVQPKPTTAEDLLPAFREHYAGLYHPSAEFFNSSVAQFVEVSWRWHVAGKIAGELWREAPHYTRPWEESEAWFNRLCDCERIVLEHIERIDDHVRAEDTGTLWTAVVTELTHAGN